MRFWWLPFLCALLQAAIAHAAPSATRPNIILITLDTTRADRMGFLGSTRGLTPNLDSFAKQAVVFTRAYSQEPLTTPSHASILSGTYPQFNHVSDLGAVLGKDVPYLPAGLRANGYRTAAFVGSSILDPAMAAPGFDRGFQIYDAKFHRRAQGEDRYQSVERRADEVVQRALAWAGKQTGPIFMWIHVYDAHDPYDPPEPFKTRYSAAPYDGEIAYVDAAMGKLLAGLRTKGLSENAVIAIMADHGEAFGEHGEERHGMFLYDETIHVPLLIRFPKNRYKGAKVDARVPLLDVAPTLLREAGVSVPATMQGQSLEASIETGVDRQAYAETTYPTRAFGWSGLHSLRAGKYLYIQAPKRELYDQSVDPNAEKNLAGSSGAVTDTLNSQLEELKQKTSRAIEGKATIDPAQAEQLRALGYLASDSASATDDAKATTDPKDKIATANMLHQALVDVEMDQADAAIPKLEQVLKEEPNAHAAYLELGRAWIRQEQYQKALPLLQKAVELTPDSGIAHFELGLALVKTGAWEAAAPAFETAVAKAPRSAEAHFDLGGVYARLKRVPEAAKEFEAALQLDPDHYKANLIFGHMLLLERKPGAALPKLQKAAKLKPEAGEPHLYLAQAYSLLGQEQNARREGALAERLRPKDSGQ
jgi:arylsulfatase A-like enzyme/Tfp pilus assembly protein PilF